MRELERAKALYLAGNLREAATLLGQVLRFQPQNAYAMQLMGTIQFQNGFAREGQKMVEKALAIDPKLAEGWNNLGLIFHFGEDNDRALESFTRSTDADPSFSEGWKNLAFILQLQERHQDALEALSHAKNTVDVHFFRGNSFLKLGRHEEAIAEYDRALAIDSRNNEVWHNRGNAFLGINRPDLALDSIKRSLQGAGQNSEFHASLAAALIQADRSDEALPILELVEKWQPGFERAKHLRMVAEARIVALSDEAKFLQQSEDPEVVLERGHLARSLQNQGRWREAIDSLQGSSNGGLRFISALTLPVLCRSSVEVEEALAHLDSSLDQLIEDPARIDDPHLEIGLTSFHLPYFGARDRPYQEKIAQALYACSPSLNFTAEFSPGKTLKKRLGIASALLHEHTISKVFGGLIEALDKEKFEIVFLQIGKDDDVTRRLAKFADHHLRLPTELAKAREMIARANLDLLFYPELGMFPLTYYLAFSRLAPVQLTTWGHPYTTGSPEIDYYITGGSLDPEDGQKDYTEKLVRLPSFFMHFEPPQSPPQWSRSEFGLPEGKRLYGCAQMPYKFHPDYDRVLGQLMDRDPDGILVLVEPQRALFKEILLERWSKYPGLADRVHWLHLMPHDRFLRLLQLTDVQLAPIQFGAGRSSLDAMAVGSPMVTWRGPYLKSRITAAIYDEMQWTELVASDEEAYVDLAVKVANDRDFNAHARSEILQRSKNLFSSRKPGEEFNQWLQSR